MTDPDPVTAQIALNRRTNPPGGVGTPARDLTQEEARDVCVYYALNGWLDLDKPIAFGKDSKPTYPKVGEKPTLGLMIGGVNYVADNKDFTRSRTGPMDMRTAALGVRFAQYLAARWGTTVIFWGGMGYGRDSNDRHGRGLAIDFHGASGGGGFYNVQRDWGNHRVTLPDGTKASAWPNNQQPYFRLDVDTKNGAFFYDVYRYLTTEAVDTGIAHQSSIGDRSFILCPDMPDNFWRPRHQNHIHFEIGR